MSRREALNTRTRAGMCGCPRRCEALVSPAKLSWSKNENKTVAAGVGLRARLWMMAQLSRAGVTQCTYCCTVVVLRRLPHPPIINLRDCSHATRRTVFLHPSGFAVLRGSMWSGSRLSVKRSQVRFLKISQYHHVQKVRPCRLVKSWR